MCVRAFMQCVSVLVALVLRLCVYTRERDFENLEEGEGQAQRPSSSQIQVRKTCNHWLIWPLCLWLVWLLELPVCASGVIRCGCLTGVAVALVAVGHLR
jgi:hypothetical protein